VSGRVYDVTTYLRDHPGGSRTITPWCGQESTEAFATEDGEGEHSDEAYALLEDYLIGDLAG
jgi:cytochrome b involved in lipid metabolism